MTLQELNDVKVGTPISYPQFKNITLFNVCDRYVTMSDSNNDTKKVYIELFLKYGKII
jgi:hypothetical protein